MMQNPLAKYEELIYSIEQAKTVTAAIDKMAKADALKAYTRKIGMDIKGQNLFAEARIMAERRAGQLLQGMEKAKPGPAKKIGTQEVPNPEQQTLDDLGVSKKESSNWQRLTEVPVPQIRKYIKESSENKRAATSAGARRIAIQAATMAFEVWQ